MSTPAPYRKTTVTGFVLALVVAAYLLPIWGIALYLAIASPYESGIGWIMGLLAFVGVLFLPVVFLASLVLGIVGTVRSEANRALGVATFAILGASVVISVVLFVALSL